MSYKITISEDARSILDDLDANFEAQIRALLPSLFEENSRVKSLGDDRVLLVLQRDAEEWDFVTRVEKKKNRLVILGAYRRLRWPELSREVALKIVEEGIGKRPDLPSGAEYVRQIKGIWRGLLPRERHDS